MKWVNRLSMEIEGSMSRRAKTKCGLQTYIVKKEKKRERECALGFLRFFLGDII